MRASGGGRSHVLTVCWAGAAPLLLTICAVVAGQDQAVITVRQDNSSQDVLNISFTGAMFKRFHACLCQSQAGTCTAKYSTEDAPNMQVVSTQSEQGLTNSTPSPSTYYTCVNDAPRAQLNCQHLGPFSNVSTPPVRTQIFHLPNSGCGSSCVGLLWSSHDENVTFTSGQLDVEFCNRNCVCSDMTTATTTTTTTTATTTTTTTTAALTTTPDRTQRTSVPEYTTSEKGPPTDANASGNHDDDDHNTSLLVGIMFSMIVVIVIVVVVGIIWWKRGRQPTLKPPELLSVNTAATPSAGVNGAAFGPQHPRTVEDNGNASAGVGVPSRHTYTALEAGECTAAEHAYTSLEPTPAAAPASTDGTGGNATENTKTSAYVNSQCDSATCDHAVTKDTNVTRVDKAFTGYTNIDTVLPSVTGEHANGGAYSGPKLENRPVFKLV